MPATSSDHFAIVQRRAAPYGIAIVRASNPKKKYRAFLPDGSWSEFGSAAHEDYLQHGDETRRRLFRTRMRGVLLLNGKRAIDKFGSAAWLSYNLLW